ncbi:MAG: hypothetical protein ACRC8J_00230 [Phocaeicola sp.]
MKTLAFLFVAAVAFSACGNKSANNATTEETVVETVVAEPVAVEADSTASCCGGDHQADSTVVAVVTE